MRILGIVFVALLITTVAWAAEERPRCENCGMYWDASSTRVEFTVKIEGKTHTHRVECIGCMHDLVHETYGEVKPESISILDYSTFGSKNEKMIDAFKAWYLFDTKALKGSMMPFVAAFANQETAKEYQKELGGELADFAGMRGLMMKAKGEDAGTDGHDHKVAAAEYVCPCTGDCCTDILASEPGECPKCGMELVKKG